MEDIATIDLQQYIKKKLFNPETERQKIWLHNLPNDETLFDIINKIRKTYTIETLVFTEEIRIIDKTINYIDLSYCIFKDRIHIENCIFEEYISFEGSILEKNIFPPAIEDSLFKNIKISSLTINFQGTIFNNLKFENIEFLQIPNIQGQYTNFKSSSLCDVTFEDVKFHIPTIFEFSQLENVSFKNCTFKGNTDFRDVSFKGKSEFLNCTFDSSENNTIKKVNFSGCTFEQEANFSGSIFNLKADFSETIFGIKKENNNSYESSSEVKFLIENAKFQKKVDFSKAIFYDAIYFSGTEFYTDTKVYEKESINFENAQFKRKVRFHHCKFHNTVRFENTSFNKLVDFYCAHFYKPQQFHFTDFLDRAIFSNTEFNEEVQFLHCKVDNSYVRFESATFNKGLDISRSNFNDKVNFWNIEIEESGEQYIFNNLKNVKYANDFEVQDKTPTIYKQFRETYRIIKDNFYSQNNKIEGLKFYEKEMSVYLEEKRAEDKNTRQSKEKNKSLTSNFKPNIITNSNKIKFNNIKKKYLNTYNFLDLIFFSVISLLFLTVCFAVIYLLLYLPFSILCLAINLLKKAFYKVFKNIKEKIINIYKCIYPYIRIFIRICFNRLIALKNNNFFLFIVTSLTIIFILGIMYIVQHKYIWYWFFVFLIILLFYIISYQNRKIIKSNIKSNNYISLVLLSIPSIIILVIFYGINNYKNDWIYRLLNYLSIHFSIIVKDEQIFSFILTIISIITAIVLAIISNKQDKLLLWFNKNSNIFGTDWVVGINFTILVTLVAYIIILYSSPNLLFLPNLEGVGNFLKGLVDILNLTDWNDITILGEKPTSWQYVFLFIARIFVAYGVYQTIQAFRKFGKS